MFFIKTKYYDLKIMEISFILILTKLYAPWEDVLNVNFTYIMKKMITNIFVVSVCVISGVISIYNHCRTLEYDKWKELGIMQVVFIWSTWSPTDQWQLIRRSNDVKSDGPMAVNLTTRGGKSEQIDAFTSVFDLRNVYLYV